MQHSHLFRLSLRVDHAALQIQHLQSMQGRAPGGIEDVDAPVPPGIIGYWVELNGPKQEVLYRRFIHHLPLNPAFSCHHWSERKRARTCYNIDLPALSNARVLRLYEQCIESPSERRPVRQQRLQVPLPSHPKKVQRSSESHNTDSEVF